MPWIRIVVLVSRAKVNTRHLMTLTNKQFISLLQLCFLCMKTRFGLFSRGTRCEMCRQVVCSKCFNKVQQLASWGSLDMQRKFYLSHCQKKLVFPIHHIWPWIFIIFSFPSSSIIYPNITDEDSSRPLLLRPSVRPQPARHLPGAGDAQPGQLHQGEDLLPRPWPLHPPLQLQCWERPVLPSARPREGWRPGQSASVHQPRSQLCPSVTVSAGHGHGQDRPELIIITGN